MSSSHLRFLCLLLFKPDADPYDRPLHTLALRVLRAADPHALSVSLRHREYDRRAASVRENDGHGGRKILLWTQLRRFAAKMVHEKSRDHFRAGPAGNAPSHRPRGEARGASRPVAGFVFPFLARVVSPAKRLGGRPTHRAAAGESRRQSGRTRGARWLVPRRGRTAASHGRDEPARPAPGRDLRRAWRRPAAGPAARRAFAFLLCAAHGRAR